MADLDIVDPQEVPFNPTPQGGWDWIKQQRQSAQMSVINAQDTTPDDAARAVQLGQATGVDPSLVNNDLENFERQHKAALSSEIVARNKFLQQWINDHPMAAAVGSDDLHSLDAASQAGEKSKADLAKPWWEIGAEGLARGFVSTLGTAYSAEQRLPAAAEAINPVEAIPHALGLLGKAGKAIRNSIDSLIPLTTDEQESIAGQIGQGVGSMLYMAPTMIGGVTPAAATMGLLGGEEQAEQAEAKGATPGQVAGAFAAGGASSAVLGAIPLHQILGPVELIAPGVTNFALAKLKQAGKVGLTTAVIGEIQQYVSSKIAQVLYDPKASYQPDVKRGIANSVLGALLGTVMPTVRAYHAEEKIPPYGLHPSIDEAHEDVAKVDVDNLNEELKEAQGSATRERAPQLFEAFERTLHGDATISLDAGAVRKLYGDKPSAPDDGLLGWVPNLDAQLRAAEQFNGRVEVPRAAWLAHVEPEVAKALKDDIAVRPGAPTANEISAAKELEPEPAESEKTVSLRDQARQAIQNKEYATADDITLREIKSAFPNAEKKGYVYDIPITDSENKSVGHFEFNVTPDAVEAHFPFIEDEFQGKGSGVAAYQKLVDWALATGREFRSDRSISPQAVQIYSALERRGYSVVRDETANVSARGAISATRLEPPIRIVRAPIKDAVDSVRRMARIEPVREAPLTLSRVVDEDADPAQHVFDFNDENGKRVGGGVVSEQDDGKTLRIEQISAGTAKGMPGVLGPAQVRNLLRQLQAEFPNAKRITGLKAAGLPREGQEAGIDLAKAIENPELLKQSAGLNLASLPSAKKGGVVSASTGTANSLYNVPLKDVISKLNLNSMPQDVRLLTKFFGNKLTEMVGNVPVHILSPVDIDKIGGRSTAGFYINKEGLIALASDYVDGFVPDEEVARTVIHEAAHAASVEAMGEFPQLQKAVKELMALSKTNLAPEQLDQFSYAFTNHKEFVAEGFSNVKFREALKDIKVTPELADALALNERTYSAWDAFKSIIKQLWTKMFGKVPEASVMDAFFRLGEAFEEANAELEQMQEFRPKSDGVSRARRPEQPELPGMTRMEDRKAFEKSLANVMFTSKGYQKYLEGLEKQDAGDQKLFAQRAEKLERARQTKEWKEDLERTKKEVREQVINRPHIATDQFLREGVMFGEKLPGRPRLDTDRLTAEQRKGIPDDYMKSGGVNPEDVATNFGYGSVDEMLEGLRQHLADRGKQGPNEYLNQLVDKIANSRMEEQFGNLEENIHNAAKEHITGEDELNRIHQEVVALHDKFAGETELPVAKKALESWVRQQFDKMPISVHSVDTYLAAAGRSGKGVELSLLDDDFREAFKFKQQQYISLLMAREAKKYEKARASFDTLAKRLAKTDLTSVLPADYAAFSRLLLQRAGLRIGRLPRGLQDDLAAVGKSLLDWAKHEAEITQVPMMLSDLAYTDWNKPLNEMTHEEFKKFSTDVRTLYSAGRETQSINTAFGKASLENFVGDLKTQLDKKGPRNTQHNPSKVRELIGKARQMYYGGLVQAETVFNQFDVGDKKGIFNENFSYDGAESAMDFSSRIKKYAAMLKELDKHLKGASMRTPLPDLFIKPNDGLPVNMIRENAIKMVIDSGNESNLDKMLRGWMPNEDKEVARVRVWNWLAQHTRKEDWDFAQALGDVHEEMFKDSEAMLRSIDAPVPDRIPLQEFVDPHGVTRKGWYSPIEYDPVQEGHSRKLQGLPAVDPVDPVGLMDTGYYSTTTPHGWEKRRTGYAAPTYLRLDRLGHRMQSVLFDTAFRPFVIKAGKVFRDPSFRQAVERNYGVEVRVMLDEYLKDLIGANKGANQTDIVFNHAIEFMRRNIVGQLIGFNIHTAEKHGLSALATSIAEVGTGPFAKAFTDLTRLSPDQIQRNWSFNISKSELLQSRSQHWFETIGGQFSNITLQRGKYQAWRDWILQKGSRMVALSDMLSANASWRAEYDRSMAELAKENPDVMPSAYEGKAIRYADAVVRRAHGSTAITSRPGIMRKGSFAHTFVSLFGFFNQMMQRLHEMSWRTGFAKKNFKEGDFETGTQNLKRAAVLFATSALWPALVEELVTPYTNSDRDSWGKWTAKTLLSGLSATVPGVREFVHGWVNNFETGSGILDSAWKTLGSNFSDIEKGAKMMDAQHGGKMLRDLNAIVGTLTGATTNEVGNVMKTIWDATHKTKESPKNLSEGYRELTTGHAQGQPDLIQRVIEVGGQKGRRK